MNKDEIKKSLECCFNGDFEPDCRNCLYHTHPRCNDMLCKDALNLINEQENEIERLKAKNKVLGDGVAKAFTNGFNTGRKQVEKDIRRAQIDVLNKLKDSYGLYYLSAFGVKERMLADILNPMIEELQK